LEEDHRLGRRLGAALARVVGVVEADADDLARARDGGRDARAGGDDRRAGGLGARPVGADQPWTLVAGHAEATELHDAATGSSIVTNRSPASTLSPAPATI